MNKDRFKFRVWSEKHHEYLYSTIIPTILFFRQADNFTSVGFGCFSSFDGDLTIEQCTGLKDKNGNLIYEGDVVLGSSGFNYKIIWSEMEVGWALQNLESKVCIAMNAFTADEIEIIGNVHNQGIHEQKDNK